MVLAHNVLEGQRTKDIQISQNITFDTMFLSSETLRGLKDSGFLKPSPIQLHGIPLGKCGFDLLLEAKSGTGKTAVFTVIALELLDLKKGLQVIILAPTREIAAQICDVLKQIGQKFDGLCVEVVMGGLPIQDDINNLKKSNVHIVVGSPGRLKHLIQDNHINLSSVRLFVLDEADKLMEKSFLPDIKFIYSGLPKRKQVIMSSATYPQGSKEFINLFVHGAQHICPNSNSVLIGVTQKVTFVKYNSNIVKQTENKFQELLNILTKKQFKQCLIFCNYQTRVGEIHKMLTRKKWPVEKLYSRQEQTDRLDSLKTFQEYKCRLLISTDLAARGIDAINVDLVINFEPPYDWQTYLHRIGRAGRFGSYGMAVTILSEGGEHRKFTNILEKLNINVLPLWSEENVYIDGIKLENSSQNNNSQEKFIKKLWHSICDSDENQFADENVDSFNDLMTSFKEAKVNDVESFSDLLTSFQHNHLPAHNTYQYKNVAIPNISDAIFVDGSLKYIKENAAEQLIIQNTKLNCEVSSKCKKESPESEDTKAVYSKLENNCITSSHLNKNKTIAIPGCSKDNVSSGNDAAILELSNSSKIEIENSELIKLGLPSCFSSMKNSKKNMKCSAYNVTQYKSKDHNNWYKECGNGNKISTFNQNEQPNLTPKKSKLFRHDRNVIPYNTKEKNSTIHYENNIKNSYVNWYSQLKLRTQQIEHLIYIDELSKL